MLTSPYIKLPLVIQIYHKSLRVTIVGTNINIIKEKTETPLETRRDVGPEVKHREN